MMSPYVEDENREHRVGETRADHPAILEMPYHAFTPSEFAPESGRCDKCGGSEGAAEHQKPVDQMARIADALERIAGTLEEISMAMPDGPSIDAMLDALQPKTKADGE